MESVGAGILVDDALHHLVALDLHNLLVPPLMQPGQLTRPLVHLRLREHMQIHSVRCQSLLLTAQICSLSMTGLIGLLYLEGDMF